MTDVIMVRWWTIDQYGFSGEPMTSEFPFERAEPKEQGQGKVKLPPIFSIAARWATEGCWANDGMTFIPPHRIIGIRVVLGD